MKILAFHPGVYRNLPDSPIDFASPSPAGPDLGCSIRFLVGQNGVGKTNLLRFLTSIFLALDEDFRRPRDDSPAYNVPFRLTYELRRDIITIRSDGKGRSGVVFTINDDEFAPGDIPGRGGILPFNLLVYTSGDMSEWRTTFDLDSATPAGEAGDEAEIDLSLPRGDEERPPGWVDEEAGGSAQTETDGAENLEGETASRSLRRVHLVEPDQLKLALLACLLDYQLPRSEDKPYHTSFKEILADIQVELVGFSLLVDPQKEPLISQQRYQLGQLYDLATLPLQQWGEQLWVYDLDEKNAETGQSILSLLHDAVLDPFQLFQLLVDLQRQGIVRTTNLVLRFMPPGADAAKAITLLSESLSDGEFAFLARMALVYLLHEDESLFLLDEPETHFNDDWKRNLVDSIERALEGTHSEVILTSHAAITLTDAFPEEVILITRKGQQSVPLTLAAEPGELLLRLFGSERTVGKRAERKIEEALKGDSEEALRTLLKQVGVGYYRFQIVEELDKRVSSRE